MVSTKRKRGVSINIPSALLAITLVVLGMVPKVETPLPEANINKQVTEIIQPIKADMLPQPQQELALAVEQKAAVMSQPLSDHSALMASAGIKSSDYSYAEYIVAHESSWNVTAHNPSGATGLCQALPASKMATAGADWQTNPVTQLRWCDSYAVSRYGSWAQAYSFWLANRWW